MVTCAEPALVRVAARGQWGSNWPDATSKEQCMAAPSAPPARTLSDDDVSATDRLREVYGRLRKELARIIIGQQAVIERLSLCLFARGHALLLGVPGLAKTLLINKLAETMSLAFSRIQFTPDLMPLDLTGTVTLPAAVGG